jgi:hypothetical protein
MNINTCITFNQRDFKTLKRIETAKKASEILRSFFDKGFKTFDALLSIVRNYYPEISEKRLWNLWHFRQIDEPMVDVLDVVFEKLKTE